MKTFLTVIALLIAFTSFGQTTIKKSSIDSGGDISTNGTLKIVYTIGEVALQENNTGNIHISEGFIGSDVETYLNTNDISYENEFIVYPNPAYNFIIIKSNVIKVEQCDILDVTGKVVLSLPLQKGAIKQSQPIDITTLQSGIYFVRVGMQVHKFVKE